VIARRTTMEMIFEHPFTSILILVIVLGFFLRLAELINEA
jgi:hypothetical protein